MRGYRLPPPGSLVLVLGDLGCLADGDAGLHRFWAGFGRRLAESGCRPAALLPCPPRRCDQSLREIWRLLPWGRPGGPMVVDPEQRRQRAERLLCLVSPALRIEPGLLRAVRLLLPEDEADSGTESDVWQHPALVSTSAAGATLAADEAKRFRAAFSREPEVLQRQVLARLRLWRGLLPQEIWFEEIQCLEPASRRLLPEPEDVELARRFFVQLSQRARGVAEGRVAAGALAWYRRCEHRLTDAALSDAAVGPALHRLSLALHRDEDGYQPGAGFEPRLVPPDRLRRLAVAQQADLLQIFELAESNQPARVGSPLAFVESGNGLVQIEPMPDAEDPASFWKTGKPPSWADAWGWDEYGAWVEFSVEVRGRMPLDGSARADGTVTLGGETGQRVAQRMRWIVPGRFLMGSPENEKERYDARYDAEGPQHEVTIQEGFWLFDTACTQALWQAVMGDNPSHFQGGDRPVEQVSWDDARRFMQALDERLPGLALGLPSEAQWEYACRVGTTTPFSFGDNITPEQVNYNGNYPYAGGQKGEYRRQTVPAKSLPPNPWGLYAMHGNVREWMQDAWHNNYDGAPNDGSAWALDYTGAARVICGGSWGDFARDCRSAYRNCLAPDDRDFYLGFRCARVQAREAGGRGDSGACEPALARL